MNDVESRPRRPRGVAGAPNRSTSTGQFLDAEIDAATRAWAHAFWPVLEGPTLVAARTQLQHLDEDENDDEDPAHNEE